MARILLVRHGETAYNSAERYWGSTDVPLGEVGLHQAALLRNRFAREKIDFVYSSILQRAMVTAQAIAAAHALQVIPCPELKEINFGKIEGLNLGEVNELYPQVIRFWRERSPELRYPGGESLYELEERVTLFHARLAPHNNGETIVVVAHSGVLRSLICQLLELDVKHHWMMHLDLASLSIITNYPERPVLTLLNDVSHLMDGAH